LGDVTVKSAKIERLLASSALGLALLFMTHPVLAQPPEQAIEAAVPMPDTSQIPPPTAQDIGRVTPAAPAPATLAPAAPAPAASAESKADAASPSAEPAKAAATAATPTTTVADATSDSAVADSLRSLISGKQFDRAITRKLDREGIEAFYKARDYAPLWLSHGAIDDRAKAAIAYLAQTAADGLDPTDYPVPDFKSAITAQALAEDEIKLTASVLTYARQAQIGRIHFSRVGADIEFKLVAPEPAEVLAKLADAKDVAAALDSYNPPQQEFKALKAKLAELRGGGSVAAKAEETKPAPVHVADGKTLHVGMKDARVIALRKRLAVAGDKDNTLYDQAVSDAVKAFQTQADIGVDGNLGPNTVRALNGETQTAQRPPADPIDTIVVNMERWRWLPRDLGNPHVIVNVPDYTLALWNDGKVYWHSKIVAGKPGKATPMVSAEMKFITVNPTWNVPPSIIENEYLPALQQDPEALDRIGLKITQDPDGTVHIFQPPGAANALGRIRFNFPNKFLVYQHDTPDKYLFARDKRAYSHGCMRVQDPFVYGEKLLSLALPSEHYTAARLEKLLGDNEININFPKPIWVHLTYQTAFVDEDGKLQFRDDVYGRDARMIAILKGSERKVADIAIERKPDASSKPVRVAPGTYGGTSYSSSGPSFFDMLFGGARAQQPQPVNRPRNFIGPHGVNGRYSAR
jgi:murein L,D-transpeptidase YcbB/YkuD